MYDRKLTTLLSATALPALLTAMTVMACSRDTTASNGQTEAERAANEAARSAALASGVASDAVDNLVAANDALLLRIEELEGRLERTGGTAQQEQLSRFESYAPAAPARDNYRTADYVEPRASEAPVTTYQAPSSRWDVGYDERDAAADDRSDVAYEERNAATDVALRNDDWRARTISRDPPLPSRDRDRTPDREVPRRREPTYRRLTVDAGTPISIRIRDEISTRYSRVGDSFNARLANDLLADNGRVAIPAGAAVTGHVSEVRKSQRIGGRTALTVSLDRIELPDGSTAPLRAAWATKGKSQTPKDAATIGGATVGGAILGRILDKGDGDVIGGLVGAAAGTALAKQKIGKPIVLGNGALLRMHLRAPIEVRVRS
jgi:type IV secretory pathway VirB10-like protein